MKLKLKNNVLWLFVVFILVVGAIYLWNIKNADFCCRIIDDYICKVNFIPKNSLFKTIGVKVKIAATYQRKALGLMFLKTLKDIDGMLFVYKNKPQRLDFWMKNTYIDLIIFFIKLNGDIDSIYWMTPEPYTKDRELTVYSSLSRVAYALELGLYKFNEKFSFIKKDKISDVFDVIQKNYKIIPCFVKG